MTEAEELELLELEEQEARAAKSPEWSKVAATETPDPVTLGAGSTGAAHAARHLSFGLGDKIIAGMQSVDDYRKDKTGQSLGDIYEHNLAFNDRLLEDSDKAHPAARWVGNGLGIGGNLAALAAVAPARAALAARGLLPAAAKAVPAATILGRTIQGALEGGKTGGALGAVGGFGSARGDNAISHTALGAALGLLTGGTLGAAGGAGAGWLAQRQQPKPSMPATIAEVSQETGHNLPVVAKGIVPDPEAQVLQKYGVPLTLGQMQPGGMASEAEEAALRVPFLGKVVEGQRKAAEQGWRNAVIDQARTPLEGPLRAGDAMGALNGIKKDFRVAYGQIADRPAAALAAHPETGELVHPREALKAIFADPTYQAGGDDLRAVGRIFTDQLAKVENLQSAGEPIKAGVLMDMREGFRDAAHLADLNGKRSLSMMFADAAESLTGGLKGTQLPRDVEFLNKTDAAYSKFMKVAGATMRAGHNVEEGEFGPKQLGAELMKSYGLKFATDKDAGGPLRELARAGKYAFTPREAATGHGEKLRSALGLGLGHEVARVNADPGTQKLFMLAARRAAERGTPDMLPPSAGEIERALAGALNRAPVTASSVSPAIAGLQDLLGARRK